LVGAAASAGAPPELKLALIGALCAHRERAEALHAIAPLARDPDLLVAALAEQEVAKRCAP
jgi:hypothetical protein